MCHVRHVKINEQVLPTREWDIKNKRSDVAEIFKKWCKRISDEEYESLMPRKGWNNSSDEEETNVTISTKNIGEGSSSVTKEDLTHYLETERTDKIPDVENAQPDRIYPDRNRNPT